MPLYEYCCNKCGAEFEEMASSSATTTPPCPQCASGDTKKLMSACRARTKPGQTGARTASSGGGGGCSGCAGGNCASCH
ncbi:MAG: putative regulatory protein, FmdB family [Solidesulfovibrio magneticus str. Maddingley MBC34]|uniref:Putative regulatory protein, FmdB family n=1 Tax=Solidesulfovibrio magneticus str. Maddingley MBC34 TaxID=1206767 RepID=K6GH56_9BACT|nr:MAG: putative regulatory protein, FmdB family [Solidesulfovibrio magneticus str. Maddingley MBC34]